MNDKEENQKAVPPYLPYKSFINFLDGLSPRLPQRIDRSVNVPNYVGVSSGSVMRALKYFNLITDNGDTTPALEKLVHSEGQRKQALKIVLKPAYPFLFENGLHLERATHVNSRNVSTELEPLGIHSVNVWHFF